MTHAAQCSHYRRKRPLAFTIDVLTDGSEGTGDGTLFLSVWKATDVPTNLAAQNDTATSGTATNWLQHTPLARYAISGLGDATGRLCTDQRYKLGVVRALFAPHQRRSWWGLPSLLHALERQGVASLTIVARNIGVVEQLVDPRRPYPRLQLCQVPPPSQSDMDETIWWCVYQDEYIVAHARAVGNDNNNDSLMFLYTLLDATYDKAQTFLLVPADCQETSLESLVQSLPNHITVNKSNGDTHISLRLGLAINLNAPNIVVGSTSLPCYYTQPSHHNDQNVIDPGLLVRAQKQGRRCHDIAPTYFPWNESAGGSKLDVNRWRMRTNTSLVLDYNLLSQPVVIDRATFISNEEMEGPPLGTDLLRFLQHLSSSSDAAGAGAVITDDNEIEIDDSSDDDQHAAVTTSASSSSPAHLLVLGTGCAQPSPLRGASGYAILSDDGASTFVFEVGEGFVTQWCRHAPSHCSLASIGVIWISHAHWDHYGGLVPLLCAIQRHKYATEASDKDFHENRPCKAARLSVALTVIAPRKVLHFVNVLVDNTDQLFECLALEDCIRSLPPRCLSFGNSPIIELDSMSVDHSARSSFGFVAALRLAGHSRPFLLAFSGDTRPCRAFVKVCAQFAARYDRSGVDFLIHEATFHDDDQAMAKQKKHSTVHEALHVAQQVHATRVLLTHFSQRYREPLQFDGVLDKYTVGCALDGMMMPL